MTPKEYRLLKESIDKAVRHTIDNIVESRDSVLTEDKKAKNKKAMATKRAEVLRWLKSKSINNAEIMRRLWNPQKDEEDALRSLFSKKMRKKDADNKSYQFTDSEINRLYNIKSSM